MRVKLTALTILAMAGVIAACSPKPAVDTSSASAESPAAMSDMSAMAGMSGMDMDTAAKTGKGVGEITAIDTKAGMVTIKHDAIPEVGWPAMTMAFKANPSSLLNGMKVGEKITFNVSVNGPDAEVTAIQPK